jgi:hypothetical protein
MYCNTSTPASAGWNTDLTVHANTKYTTYNITRRVEYLPPLLSQTIFWAIDA